MRASFIAVLLDPGSADAASNAHPALLAAGARVVLHWSQVATCEQLDDDVAVLFEHADATELDAFAQLSRGLAGRQQKGRTVLVSTGPVTDTLKVVAPDGRLTGIADRDEHRIPAAPMITLLGLLRAVAVAEIDPDPIAVLTALADRGATILDAAAVAAAGAAVVVRPSVSSAGVRLAVDRRRR